MKKFSKTIVAMLSMFILLPNAMAGTSEVTWTSPEKYRDIRPATESKKRFEDSVMKNLEAHIVELAAKLPEGQMLKVNVTDVDLAGDVNYSGSRQIRVVKDIFFPRIKFGYKLESANGEVISQGDVDLKDMNFLHHNRLKYRNDRFGYEKKMLDDWFNDTFYEKQS
ncbi:DUF3016 domain-containing protein [Thalassotalea fusca]